MATKKKPAAQKACPLKKQLKPAAKPQNRSQKTGCKKTAAKKLQLKTCRQKNSKTCAKKPAAKTCR